MSLVSSGTSTPLGLVTRAFLCVSYFEHRAIPCVPRAPVPWGAMQIDAETQLPPHEPKSAWEPPKLTKLGDVRELTLGGSPGAGDSGNPTTFRPPGT